jgi:osmotically inducible protein OsmC
MAIRNGSAVWWGDLRGGSGDLTVGDGVFTGPYSYASRFELGDGTNPEELIAAAHAACFSMALSNVLAKAGTPPEALDTRADVTFQPGEGITGIVLTVRAHVHGISPEDFQAAAQDAKVNCPVSKALTGTTVTLDASLDNEH